MKNFCENFILVDSGRESFHTGGYLGGSSSLPFTLKELEYDHADMTTSDVLKGIGLRGSI